MTMLTFVSSIKIWSTDLENYHNAVKKSGLTEEQFIRLAIINYSMEILNEDNRIKELKEKLKEIKNQVEDLRGFKRGDEIV